MAAVGLPTVIACADQFLLQAANSWCWNWQAVVLVFAGFVIQTALLCQAIGQWLPNWPWRLGVLVWGIVLTNLLLFRATTDGGLIWFWSWTNPVRLLSNAFLSAQWSAIIVWLMLGSVPLGKRAVLGAMVVAPPAIMALMLLANHIGTIRTGFWAAVMLVQLVATTGLTALLSALRWRIVRPQTTTSDAAVPWLQFSIRHILIATTAAAVFTALGKAIVVHSAGGMGWKEWLQVAINGSLLGALSLVAVWAALGEGGAALRMTLLLLLSVLLAGLLWWAEVTAEAALSPGASSAWWFRQSFAGRWWIGWTLLAGTFLASWLSVLRVTGYRLVRQQTDR
jgi:hypothetical protein